MIWDPTRPPTLDNVALLNEAEAAHHRQALENMNDLDSDLVHRVLTLQADVREYMSNGEGLSG